MFNCEECAQNGPRNANPMQSPNVMDIQTVGKMICQKHPVSSQILLVYDVPDKTVHLWVDLIANKYSNNDISNYYKPRLQLIVKLV